MNHSKHPSAARMDPAGFTLVELLVVIAIISILMALALPGVQAAREAARRTNCARQLSNLAIAIHKYEMAMEVYPAGTLNDQGPIRNIEEGTHHGWLIQLLPYLDDNSAYMAVDQSLSVYDLANAPVRQLTRQKFLCPSQAMPLNSPNGRWTFSSYAAVHHDVESPIDVQNNGVFFLNSRVRYENITDGSSYTFFCGEKRIDPRRDLGWMSGTAATLRNTGTAPIATPDEATSDAGNPSDPALHVGGFASAHPSGLHFVLGDGSVRFIGNSINTTTYQRLGHRADGSLLDDTGW